MMKNINKGNRKLLNDNGIQNQRELFHVEHYASVKVGDIVKYRGREGVVDVVRGFDAYVVFDAGWTFWVPAKDLRKVVEA